MDLRGFPSFWLKKALIYPVQTRRQREVNGFSRYYLTSWVRKCLPTYEMERVRLASTSGVHDVRSWTLFLSEAQNQKPAFMYSPQTGACTRKTRGGALCNECGVFSFAVQFGSLCKATAAKLGNSGACHRGGRSRRRNRRGRRRELIRAKRRPAESRAFSDRMGSMGS